MKRASELFATGWVMRSQDLCAIVETLAEGGNAPNGSVASWHWPHRRSSGVDRRPTSAMVKSTLTMAIEARRPGKDTLVQGYGSQFMSWTFSPAGAVGRTGALAGHQR